MEFRPHGNCCKMKKKENSWTCHVPNLRFYSNTRPVASRENKVIARPAISLLSRRHHPQALPQAHSQISRSAYHKIKECKTKTYSLENAEELNKDLKENNDSLFIECLYAVPKARRLNPLREKLIRLFNSSLKEKPNTSEKSVITCENSDWVLKEEVETPSPVIKPKYLHKY